MTHVDFIARTAKGATIATFADRSMAIAWADTEGHLFPGYVLAKVERQVIERTVVIRRDRSHLKVAA